MLQLALFSGLLVEYNFLEHVASDIKLGQQYLPSSTFSSQDTINQISNWTEENLMRLNEAKCYYMIFSRTKTDFTTRLKVNEKYLERKSFTQLLGVWIDETVKKFVRKHTVDYLC